MKLPSARLLFLGLSVLGGLRATDARPDELARQLQRLAAGRAEVRDRAERYVAGHLRIEDYPRLAEVATAGDAEVRTRLARVIAAEDRYLELAALLLAEENETLKSVGEEALTRSLSKWNPNLAARGLVGRPLQNRLREAARGAFPHRVLLELGGALVDRCSSLQREAEMPVGITIASQLFVRDPIHETRVSFEGHWLNALFVLGRTYGVGIEAHGLPRREREDEPVSERSRAFLRFAPLSDLGVRSGLQLMLQWFRTLSSSQDASERSRAAHNLARSGWPGALSWMQRLAVTGGDEAAWEGLLIAAAHGRRVPMLLRPDALAHLMMLTERRLESAADGAAEGMERLLAAYRDVGCLHAQGPSLEEVFSASWEGLTAGAKALRLALLESLGCSQVSGLSRARAVAGDARAPVALRWQALHTAVRIASVRGVAAAPPEWPDARRMFEPFYSPAELAQAVALLWAAGIQPTAEWSEIDPEISNSSGELKTALMLWWLAADQPQVAAAYLIELLETDEIQIAIDALTRFEAEVSCDLLKLLDFARKCAEGPGQVFELERAGVLLGLQSADAFLSAFSREEQEEYLNETDFALWGAMGAWGDSRAASEARATLLAQLRGALSRGGDARRFGSLVRALEGTIDGLFRRGEDAIAGAFHGEIGLLTIRSPETGLARALGGGWPPPPQAHLRVLRASPAGLRIRELYGL
ncbi:MAG: hypothetical protein CMJ89_16330 [Planctomycetes bacterium]|jgi:hypothetical protein|nr:hypothetical protein [Planctomycetota bacterium]